MESETREFVCLEVLLQAFRNHLRLTTTDMDGILMENLTTGIDWAEHEISSVIPLSNFTYETEFAPSIPLRFPTNEVTSVKVDGVMVPATDYTYNAKSLTFSQDVTGSKVEVCYLAGFQKIPFSMRSAILLKAASLFNNPTDRPEEKDKTSASNLLRPYRRWGKH